jgi:APA family basic amino acid/polyamine antiporter
LLFILPRNSIVSAYVNQSNELRRRVGVADATFIILGNIIGVGIFITPVEVARTTQEPWIFLAMWLIGAIVALAGAMSSAELGIMMPHAGGDYVFLRKTFGLPWGFLYGYLSLIFTYTGSIAVMAFAVVHYNGPTILGDDAWLQTVMLSFDVGPWSLFGLIDFDLFEYRLRHEHMVACALILSLTMLNIRGLSNSLMLQKIVTVAPVIFLVVAGLIILFNGLFLDPAALHTLEANLSFHGSSGMPGPGVFAAAMIPVFFTYTGWNVTLYLAEDIKDPRRVIPLSMIIGLGAVAIVYFLFCTVLLATIPFSEMLGPNPGDLSARVMGVIFGHDAKILMSFVIAFLILGTLNTTILAGSRVYLAMARDGIFFSRAKRLHAKFGTPSWSLWAQGLWACGLVVIFLDFDTILSLTTLMMVFLSMMTISSVFVLRWRHGKDHEIARMETKGPLIRALGYPYFPAFYVLATASILIGTVLYKDNGADQALLGLLVSLFGFVVYFIWRRFDTRKKQ